MKILHIIPTIEQKSGGPSNALIQYAISLRNLAEIEIATTRSGLDGNELKKIQSAMGNIPIHSFDSWGTHSRNISWPMFVWLKKNVGRYDLLHIHALFSPMSTLAAFWARRLKAPYVIRPLGTISPYTFSSGNRLLKRIYFQFIERQTLLGASAIQFTSPLEMEKASRVSSFNHSIVIPNPVEPFSKNGLEGHNRNSSRKILFLSRIHPKKGLDLLLQAMKELLKRHHDAELIVAGTGSPEYVKEVKKLTRSLGLLDRVQFLGFIEGEKKQKLFQEATLLALPSYDENFGMAIAEAMASGLPVLVSDQVGIWPDIQEYNAGVVVRCEVDSIKNGLEKLIENPELSSEMGKRGKQLVQDRYSSEKVARQLLALYHEILSSPSVRQDA